MFELWQIAPSGRLFVPVASEDLECPIEHTVLRFLQQHGYQTVEVFARGQEVSQVIHAVVDSVVGDAVLRKVVRADFLRPPSRPDLNLSVRPGLQLLTLQLLLVNSKWHKRTA